MKHTAVEWLIKELYFYPIDDIVIDKFNQAKEMERQQIIDFADEYGTYLLKGGTMSAASYNETFKSE